MDTETHVHPTNEHAIIRGRKRQIGEQRAPGDYYAASDGYWRQLPSGLAGSVILASGAVIVEPAHDSIPGGGGPQWGD